MSDNPTADLQTLVARVPELEQPLAAAAVPFLDGASRLEMGRRGWFEEALAFYDQHLEGVDPASRYPAHGVQDDAGSWPAQDTWPVVKNSAAIPVGGGFSINDGGWSDPAVETDSSFYQWSEPITQSTRITGRPRVFITATGFGNVMIKLHDVAPDGTAIMVVEKVATLSSGRTTSDLKSTDWTLAPRHVLAVEVGTIRSGPFSNWLDTPTHQTIDVTDVQLDLSLDTPRRQHRRSLHGQAAHRIGHIHRAARKRLTHGATVAGLRGHLEVQDQRPIST